MKAKLLVADDEKHIREGLQKALSLDGYEVELAQDGKVALDKVEELEGVAFGRDTRSGRRSPGRGLAS